MGFSKLVNKKVKAYSGNYSKGRDGNKISKITIHHMAGNLTIEQCGKVFQAKGRYASSNYGIDSKGRIGGYVDENNRPYTSSSYANDVKAVTIEVANNGGAKDKWSVSDKALQATIDLCVDICKRNGIKKLNYNGKSSGNLTRHNMFVATTCPGPYLQSKFSYIEEQVNKKLNEKIVIKKWAKKRKFKSTVNNLHARLGPSTKTGKHYRYLHKKTKAINYYGEITINGLKWYVYKNIKGKPTYVAAKFLKEVK